MHANGTIDELVAPWLLTLTVAAAVVFVSCVLVALLEAGLVAVTHAPPWHRSPVPPGVRRLAFAVCGVGLTLPPIGAAAMEPPPPAGAVTSARDASCPPSCTGRLTGLRLPDLPVRDQPRLADTVTVRPGDCLWTIATDRLPPAAADREVAALTQAIYRTNHARIGPDPDLIFPGTRLKAPEAPR